MIDLLSNPLRILSTAFAIAIAPFALFLAVHEWRGVIVTVALLVGMAFVLGYEVATRYGGES